MPVPIFDINNDFSVSYLPSYKRLPKWIQTIRGYISGVSWLDIIFRKFMDGSDDLSFYDSTITYLKGDRIKNEFAVFESIKSGNLNNLTSDENWWFKVLDSFIGKTEQSKFICRKLQFEYSLNHYFEQQLVNQGLVGFKNPTAITGSSYTPLSDIYIETVIPTYFSIVGFSNLHDENSIFDNPIGYFGFDDLIYSGASFYKYSINIPIGVYNLLGANNDIRDSVVKNFVDKINTSGLQYTIVTY